MKIEQSDLDNCLVLDTEKEIGVVMEALNLANDNPFYFSSKEKFIIKVLLKRLQSINTKE